MISQLSSRIPGYSPFTLHPFVPAFIAHVFLFSLSLFLPFSHAELNVSFGSLFSSLFPTFPLLLCVCVLYPLSRPYQSLEQPAEQPRPRKGCAGKKEGRRGQGKRKELYTQERKELKSQLRICIELRNRPKKRGKTEGDCMVRRVRGSLQPIRAHVTACDTDLNPNLDSFIHLPRRGKTGRRASSAIHRPYSVCGLYHRATTASNLREARQSSFHHDDNDERGGTRNRWHEWTGRRERECEDRYTRTACAGASRTRLVSEYTDCLCRGEFHRTRNVGYTHVSLTHANPYGTFASASAFFRKQNHHYLLLCH
jgi:hypothetical protein